MTPDPQSIRTFRASSLPEALAQVKQALGPDALILGTRQIERRGIGALAGPVVEITAAVASDEATKRRSDAASAAERPCSVASGLRARRALDGHRAQGAGMREQGTGNREQDAPADVAPATSGGSLSPVASGLLQHHLANGDQHRADEVARTGEASKWCWIRARRATKHAGQPPPAGNAKRVAARSIGSARANRDQLSQDRPASHAAEAARPRAFDIPHSTFDIPGGREVPPSRVPTFPPSHAPADPLRRWYERLVQRELGEHLARLVIDHVRRRLGRGATPADIDAAVRDELARLMPAAGGIELRPDRPTRIALVGPPGSGKTTTLAKIAAHFRLRENKRVAIVSLDAHRLGTAEQLERYGRIIGATVITIRTPDEAAVVFAESDEATERRSDGGKGAGNRAQGARMREQGAGNREQDTPAGAVSATSDGSLSPVASGLCARRAFANRPTASDEATERRSDAGQGAGHRAQGTRMREQGTGNREQDTPAGAVSATSDGSLSPVASGLCARRAFANRPTASDEATKRRRGAGERPHPVASAVPARRAFDIRHSSFDIRPPAEGGWPPSSAGAAGPNLALRTCDFDLLLIDTPGVSPNDLDLRRELSELLELAVPDEVHLVLPASLRPEVQRRTIEAFALFGVRRVVLSRLDEASGFGVVLEMLRQLDWAVSYLTTGQKVPTDLKKACGPDLAALVLSAEAAGA